MTVRLSVLLELNHAPDPRLLVLVEALLRGVSEGQDILTLSLGGADGWTEGTATVVASRIAGAGKIVTIAAGNDVSHIRCDYHLQPFSNSFVSAPGCIWSLVYLWAGKWHQCYICCQS